MSNLEFGKRPEVSEVPEEFRKQQELMKNVQKENPVLPNPIISQPPMANIIQNQPQVEQSRLQQILSELKAKTRYHAVKLPSKNIGYEIYGVPINKPVNVRPMTIEEEKVLATPSFVKNGTAISKIIESCLLEKIPPQKMHSADFTYLMYWIRGISYGPSYEFETECPECGVPFQESIDLNTLRVVEVDDDFTGEYTTTLPDSGLVVKYRIPTEEDHNSISKYRQLKLKNFTNVKDDSMIKKLVLIISKIDQITQNEEIEAIINCLPVRDYTFLIQTIGEFKFGIEPKIGMTCPYCYHNWQMNLPISYDFFSPQMIKPS